MKPNFLPGCLLRSFLVAGLSLQSVAAAWAYTGFPVARQDPSVATSNAQQPASEGKKKGEVNGAPTPAAANEATIYRIGVEDELQISVWHEPELSTSAVVRPDGKITLPLLNDVVVTGLTTEELQKLLAEKLKPFVNEPQVIVIPRNIRSRKVYLVGQVSRQGAFPLNSTKTVLELIADAGGLSPFAKSSSIYVLRTENGKKIRIPFNYKKALSGKEGNVLLLPGDTIVVP